MVRKLKKVEWINCVCKRSVKGAPRTGYDCVCRVISGKWGKRRMRDIPTKGIYLHIKR